MSSEHPPPRRYASDENDDGRPGHSKSSSRGKREDRERGNRSRDRRRRDRDMSSSSLGDVDRGSSNRTGNREDEGSRSSRTGRPSHQHQSSSRDDRNWVDDHRHPSSQRDGRDRGRDDRGRDRKLSRDQHEDDNEARDGRCRSPSGRDSHSQSRDHRRGDYRRGRDRSASSGDEGRSRSRSRSSGYECGSSSPGRKRRRDETCFSPLTDVDKDGRSKHKHQQQLARCESYELLSDPDYVAIVCGKAVQGEATRSVLAALLDAMGMEILQVRPSPANGADGGSKTTAVEEQVLDATNLTVRPMKKKAVQTPGTVRDFALLQISMSATSSGAGFSDVGGEEKKNGAVDPGARRNCTVLDEVLAAFRLAAHHVILYVDQTLVNGSSSSLSADKKQRIADFARRALMTCFVSLRGLLLRLSEQVDSERKHGEAQPSSVRELFGEGVEGRRDARGPLSAVEGMLLDIVPLLTHFIRPPLGEKHATSVLQNLLSLDETARRKKRSSKADKKRQQQSQDSEVTHAHTASGEHMHTVILRDGLMELFVRQLCQQEGEDGEKLRRELLNVTAVGAVSEIDVGAVASLQPERTRLCLNVNDTVEQHRKNQTSAIERKRRLAEAQNGPSWDHEYHHHGTKRRRVPQRIAGSDDGQDDLRLLRLDGCIYLSKIAAQILSKRKPKSPATPKAAVSNDNKSSESTAMTDTVSRGNKASPTSSQDAEEGEINNTESRPNEDPGLTSLNNASYEQERFSGDDDDVHIQRERICRLAYFLFHTLIEHYIKANADGYSDTLGLRRQDIPSAALACYLLAGKMEECPVKVKTLLGIVKTVTLPPPPSARIQKCFKRLQDLNEIKSGDSHSLGKKITLEWGRPSPDVMKQYELELLSVLGFDFMFTQGCISPNLFVPELCQSLSLDAEATTHVEDVMNDPCYTHSSLCLLGEPRLVAAATYYLSCSKTGRNLHDDWNDLLDADEGLTKLVADYAWEVRTCVKAREKQWEAFRELKSRFDASRRATESTSQRSPPVPDLLTPGSSQSDSDAAKQPWSTATDFEVEASSFECHSLPRHLSSLVGGINDYLATVEAELEDVVVVDDANKDAVSMDDEVAEEDGDTYQSDATNAKAVNLQMEESIITEECASKTGNACTELSSASCPEQEHKAEVALMKLPGTTLERANVVATLTMNDSPSIPRADGGSFTKAAVVAPEEIANKSQPMRDAAGDEEEANELASNSGKGTASPPEQATTSFAEDASSRPIVNEIRRNDIVESPHQSGTDVGASTSDHPPDEPRMDAPTKSDENLLQPNEGSNRDEDKDEDKDVVDHNGDHERAEGLLDAGPQSTTQGQPQKEETVHDLNDEGVAHQVKFVDADLPTENAATCTTFRKTGTAEATISSTGPRTNDEACADRQNIPAQAAAANQMANVDYDKAPTTPTSDADGKRHRRRQSSSPQDVAEDVAETVVRRAIREALNSPKGDAAKTKAAIDVNAIDAPDIDACTPPTATTAANNANSSTTTPAIMSEEAKGSEAAQTGERMVDKSISSSAASQPTIGKTSSSFSSLPKKATTAVSKVLKMPTDSKQVSKEEKRRVEEKPATSAPKRRMLKMPVSRTSTTSAIPPSSKPTSADDVVDAKMRETNQGQNVDVADKPAAAKRKPSPQKAPSRSSLQKTPPSSKRKRSSADDPASTTSASASSSPRKASPQDKRKRLNVEQTQSNADDRERHVKVTFGKAAFGSMLNHLCPGAAVRTATRGSRESRTGANDRGKRGRDETEFPSKSQKLQGQEKKGRSKSSSRKKRRKK